MPRCYMVKKGNQRHDGPPPCSPTEASVAPPCYSPAADSALTEGRVAEYAELGACGAAACAGAGGADSGAAGVVALGERSAADTEAAHELLSLAQSLPPLPPASVVTVLEPAPLLYTYTLQPTSIYILSEEPGDAVYHAVQAADPLDYSQLNYVAYSASPPPPPPPDPDSQQLYCEPPPSPSPLALEPTVEPEKDLEPEPEPDHDTESEVSQSSKEKLAKYDCKECGKRYATSSNLSRHKQTHRSLDSMAAKRCGECGKAYVSMPALAMHVLTHRMGHVCGVCGKQFSRPWLLRGHLRSHTGEKPYSCAACGKAFADRSNLRAHLQTHSQDKKHECARCRKTFALKSYLNKHQESACVRDDAD